jgi:hypothetical protein
MKELLTPTESSDDDEVFIDAHHFQNVAVESSGNAVKRKIAQALQSLIDGDKPGSTGKQSKVTTKAALSGDNIKFKFRMKFKSNNPQRSFVEANKRHSANLNEQKSFNNIASSKSSQIQSKTMPRTGKTDAASKVRNPLAGTSRNSTGSSSFSAHADKCRETRDLHNSMERQRRIDLRKNLDELKSVVPELADLEKASKLNILNKASNYCLSLANLNDRLTNELCLESIKNTALKKKLRCLVQSF